MNKFNKILTEESERHIKVCLDIIERCTESLSKVQYNDDIKKIYLDMIARNQHEISEWKKFLTRL